MKAIGIVAMGWALSAPVLAASPDPAAALARARNCVACHHATHKIIGPAYTAIASRYAGQADAAAALTQSVRAGSQGKWGNVPMPSNMQVSPEEAGLLVRWILQQK